jgi:stage V sporulation protein AD
MTYSLEIAGLRRELPLCSIGQDLMIAAFICFGDAELTVACAREMLKLVPPEDYDYIVTGDLGTVGSKLVRELLHKQGVDISKQHRDCGELIYDNTRQDTHCGGSGCGCSASVLCGLFLPMLENGRIENILFAATGALMSTMSLQQGESIPAIAHLVHLRHAKEQI